MAYPNIKWFKRPRWLREEMYIANDVTLWPSIYDAQTGELLGVIFYTKHLVYNSGFQFRAQGLKPVAQLPCWTLKPKGTNMEYYKDKHYYAIQNMNTKLYWTGSGWGQINRAKETPNEATAARWAKAQGTKLVEEGQDKAIIGVWRTV